ncbi:MAG: hypothetical protein J0L57_08810 [Burkholderiales bacterium]|nr:hypothetical protein [Burkholderiales bacterium]
MHTIPRPALATTASVLLAAGGLFMVWLGTMAKAYWVPGLCLFLLAALLWQGRALKAFKAVLLLNQLSAIALLVLLLTGVADALHLPKLPLAGAMLLLNLATGGPIAGVLSIPLLLSLHFRPTLHRWFGRRAAPAPLAPTTALAS